ncbi:NAD-dependent malic enzyme [Streptomyces aurantiogriseus]
MVATDAEQLLGIGDWGVGGMQISVGKLAVYTAAAGIHPGRAVPVMLDVGTGNQALLNDPLYVGNRHNRVRGEAYDSFVAAFVEAVGELFPHALLHWEDFGPGNGRRILQQYGEKIRTFNDDMQGTGAITLACVMNAARVTGTPMRDQRIVVFGAGTAGVGIADQLRDAMVRDGLDREEATRRIWCVDRQGLLRQSTEGLRDYQQPYARPDDEWPPDRPADLPSVVDRAQPTVLVGTSTQHGAFTEDVVRSMARHVDRPVVLPLSNPTEKIEAMPEDVLRWTGARPWSPRASRYLRWSWTAPRTSSARPTTPSSTRGWDWAPWWPAPIGSPTACSRPRRKPSPASPICRSPAPPCCRRWRTCAPRRPSSPRPSPAAPPRRTSPGPASTT